MTYGVTNGVFSSSFSTSNFIFSNLFLSLTNLSPDGIGYMWRRLIFTEQKLNDNFSSLKMSSVHYMTVEDKYFDSIASGEKKYEMRLYDEKRRKMKIRDTIVFKKKSDENATVQTLVQDLLVMGSFEEAVKEIGYRNLIPDAVDPVEAVDIYRSFPGYAEGEKTSYVVVIRLRLI